MKNPFIFLFLGLVVACGLSFVSGPIIPWLVGGSGVAVGVIIIGRGRCHLGAVAAMAALALALWLIEHQSFNPDWLTALVTYCRVFMAHVLLPTGLWQIRSELSKGG